MHEVIRPVQHSEPLRDFDKLMERIVALRHEGPTAAWIADCLNREGFCPPKRGNAFSTELVPMILSRRGVTKGVPRGDRLGPDEWWLPTRAERIAVSAGKRAAWVRRGWLHSRKTAPRRRWVLWADKQELRRLRKHAAASCRGLVEDPTELTTPAEYHR